jgi:hypothetical protein
VLENFQLAVGCKSGKQMRLLRVPLHHDLQASLAASWAQQLADFADDTQEVPFDAGYTPEAHERFSLPDYVLPDWLKNETSLTIPDLASINAHEALMASAKCVVGFARDDQGEELVLFQNFSRSHVIQPGRSLFMQNGAYATSDKPGIRLDGKLAAVYWPAQQKLLFHNFRITNSFLPLADFFEEASEQEIQAILNHPRLAAENPEALATGANQWFRKRFALLRHSGILDQYTAQDIAGHAQGYEVDIQVTDDKIVFPADKGAAKRLLSFLNEELFRGAITDRLYETNSKRVAD